MAVIRPALTPAKGGGRFYAWNKDKPTCHDVVSRGAAFFFFFKQSRSLSLLRNVPYTQ